MNGRNFRGKRDWGEIKRAKRPLSNSSSFIWQHFKYSPFTMSRRDSFHSRGRVLFLFVLPEYIKAIYCNSRRQTSLLVFLPQTLYFSSTLQMSLSHACVHLSFSQSNPPPLSSSSLFEAKRSETIWTCLMDNLKNSACKIRAETMFVFSWLGFRKQVVQRDLFSHCNPFKSGSQHVETTYVL